MVVIAIFAFTLYRLLMSCLLMRACFDCTVAPTPAPTFGCVRDSEPCKTTGNALFTCCDGMSCVAPANSTDGECRTVTEAPTPAPTAAPTHNLNLEYGHKIACKLCTIHAHLLEIMTAFLRVYAL
eukprot:12966-Heterococcus_DN1.PRE.2